MHVLLSHFSHLDWNFHGRFAGQVCQFSPVLKEMANQRISRWTNDHTDVQLMS